MTNMLGSILSFLKSNAIALVALMLALTLFASRSKAAAVSQQALPLPDHSTTQEALALARHAKNVSAQTRSDLRRLVQLIAKQPPPEPAQKKKQPQLPPYQNVPSQERGGGGGTLRPYHGTSATSSGGTKPTYDNSSIAGAFDVDQRAVRSGAGPRPGDDDNATAIQSAEELNQWFGGKGE